MSALVIVSRESGQPVHRIDTTGKTQGQIAHIEMGMSINFDHENYYWVEETDSSATPEGNKE